METGMTEFETSTTWPLPFAERAELLLESDLGSIDLVPVREGEEPRIEVTGEDAGEVDITVSRDGDRVKVIVDRSGRFHHPWRGREARVIVHLPREIHARVQSDVGAIDARDLGPCDLSIS